MLVKLNQTTQMKKLFITLLVITSPMISSGAELTIDQRVAKLEVQVRVLQAQVRALGKGVTNTNSSAQKPAVKK